MFKVHILFKNLFQEYKNILIRPDVYNPCIEHSLVTRSQPETMGLKSMSGAAAD